MLSAFASGEGKWRLNFLGSPSLGSACTKALGQLLRQRPASLSDRIRALRNQLAIVALWHEEVFRYIWVTAFVSVEIVGQDKRLRIVDSGQRDCHHDRLGKTRNLLLSRISWSECKDVHYCNEKRFA
jgi:hypothetical protein